MKNYVITIEDIPESVQAAERCIRSGEKYNMTIEKWSATTPRNTDIHAFLEQESISSDGFKEVYSRLDNCIAAFISHYSIWKFCAENKEDKVTIFEHDAVVTNVIPWSLPFFKVISLGKPSYGSFKTPSNFGANPLTSKTYFPGAHAYRINPLGATELIEQAKIHAKPTDVFLNIQTFPFLQEFYPWVAEVRDSFTTIQKTEGCLAKHNYGEGYAIL
jgi:GR25 family glycosyltransferase involved in LPS biosynthesis